MRVRCVCDETTKLDQYRRYQSWDSLGDNILRRKGRAISIYIVKSRSFKCSFDHAKRTFFRSLNAVFGHIGRSASEEVVINLVTHKCLPIGLLLYGTEVCPVSKSDTNSFDFAINRFQMKLFKTNIIKIIEECLVNFGVILPSSLITSRANKFMFKLQFLENSFCNMFN